MWASGCRALEKVLREAPTLAVVQTQQLMELAYVTASQPGRRAEDRVLDIKVATGTFPPPPHQRAGLDGVFQSTWGQSLPSLSLVQPVATTLLALAQIFKFFKLTFVVLFCLVFL